ncbi:MAG TPA: translation initiation factor IF-2 N-terminal domain-containing protein, partial [Acidobacteriaceae bacterium]|nr:translation initiation factor IF-2 N-terminal domain-containing protein [Acidobacteriaceae bacterium]
MSKVRINDLARELEVKSRSILDALTAVGVTESKTHSSSIEADEAEKVRNYFSGQRGGTSSAKSRSEAKPAAFNLSHVSKPGDALKAILERKQAEAAARSAPPARSAAVVASPPARTETPAPARPAVQAPVAAAVAPVASPAPRRIVPQPRQGAQIVAPTPPPAIASKPPVGAVIARPPAIVVAPAPPAPQAVSQNPGDRAQGTAPAAGASAVKTVAASAASPAAATLASEPPAIEAAAYVGDVDGAADSETAAQSPAAPAARRVVMPQTGPRPIYTAPAGAPGGPGGIQRGRPIFERPRPQAPGAPGSRPSTMAPGARRPMHPTRSFPAGTGPGGAPGRPGFTPGGARPPFGVRPGGPGAAPGPGESPTGMRPAARPGQRRGGQRYEKVKEGPMKGFQPPPRYGGQSISREPLPITKTITVTEGISVKDLAEKLDVRGKDLIATLLMKGVFVTVNQSLEGELVKEVARQFGADATVISVEEQLENEAIEGFLEDTTGMVEIARSPVVT